MSEPQSESDWDDDGITKKLKHSTGNDNDDDRKEQVVKEEEEENGHRELSPIAATASVPVNSTTPLTPVIWNQYYVVKHILEYLKLPDLLFSAGLVNQEWLKISRIVRKQRKNCPFTVLIHPYTPHHKLAFEYFNGYRVSETATELVESGRDGYHPYDKRRRNSRGLALSDRFGNFTFGVKSVLEEAVINAYDEAQMIVSFGTEGFDAQQLEETRYIQKHIDERMSIYLGSIQDTIPCITCMSCGVIGTVENPEGNGYYSLEMESYKMPCLSTLAIPKVAGLGIKTFTISTEQGKSLKRNTTVQACKEILGIDETIETQLQGIVLLHKCETAVSDTVLTIMEYLRVNPHVALAGGIHEDVLVSGLADTADTIAAGFLIYGEDKQRLRVSSVALQESKMSANNLKKMEKLQSSLLPGGSSFAFMFACNGRGKRMHSRPNVEVDVFNKLFPKTPLVGAFTYGEFCHEVLPNPGNIVTPPPKKLDYAYTTSYLVVSYKHAKEHATPSKSN